MAVIRRRRAGPSPRRCVALIVALLVCASLWARTGQPPSSLPQRPAVVAVGAPSTRASDDGTPVESESHARGVSPQGESTHADGDNDRAPRTLRGLKHGIVTPDPLERNREEHLKYRGAPDREPASRRGDTDDDPDSPAAVQLKAVQRRFGAHMPASEGAGDIDQQRAAEFRRRFGSKAERDAAKADDEERREAAKRNRNAPQDATNTGGDGDGNEEQTPPPPAGDIEAELVNVPFAERMRLRKMDTTPLSDDEPDRILEELGEAMRSLEYTPASSGAEASRGARQDALCAFLPANAHDAEHIEELRAAVDLWGDATTVLFTENRTLYDDIGGPAGPTINRAFIDLGSWKKGHHRRILHRWLLRARGSTKKQLRGRGELSMPLFYWAWRERSGLLRHCAWFMKADTDSFVNRRQLMRQLSRLDSSEALYVGTRLNFDSRGFNYSQPSMRIKFNLGGPGYIFSRGLMERLDLDACFQNMALDPIWLIHDDVGTGYCATRFLKTAGNGDDATAVVSGGGRYAPPTVVPHHGVVASTFRPVPHRLIAAALEDASLFPVEALSGSALDLAQSWLRGEPPLSPGAADCILLAQVWHPVTPAVMRALDRFLNVDSAKRAEAMGEASAAASTADRHDDTLAPHECMFMAMAGEEVAVGSRWGQSVGGALAESLLEEELVEVRREHHTLRELVSDSSSSSSSSSAGAGGRRRGGGGAVRTDAAFLKLHHSARRRR